PYQWGDPVRSIDWRVTARTGRFFVKEFENPRSVPCWLLVDTSASMVVSSQRKSKYQTAVQIAGGIALAALDRVSPVGLLGVGGREIRVEPSLAKPQVLQWLHRLRSFRYDEPTAVGRRLAELAPSLGQRCLVVLLSDLHDPSAVPGLRLLAQRHDCVALHLVDPAERGVPRGGVVHAHEAETGRAVVAWSAGGGYDPDAVAPELRRAGVDYLQITPGKPFAADLRRFFRCRNILGRGTR
ncbi:MAG: DUF58 domain-containing protein, partial [Planctomycetia bacterium]